MSFHLAVISCVTWRDVAGLASGGGPNRGAVYNLVGAYLHFAGAESGYGYFAPNIPGDYQLFFRRIRPDGIQTELTRITDRALKVRLVAFSDRLGEMRDEPLRRLLLEATAASVWSGHRDAKEVQVELRQGWIPNVAQYRNGARETYSVVVSYDFSADELARIVVRP